MTNCRNIAILTDLGELSPFPRMTAQYYMKKWSLYVNINLIIYVLTLGEYNSDTEKDLVVHPEVSKSKMTA